jgi:hypothetical protein
MAPTHTLSEICKYDANLWLTLALQQIGAGGVYAATVAAFLDLPGAHKWP